MKVLVSSLIDVVIGGLSTFASGQTADEKEKSIPAKWFKGNTHTHSLWSDGNDFPEMIVDWYAERGYDFIALSGHNILAVSDKWMDLEAIAKRQRAIGKSAMDKYQAKYGDKKGWIGPPPTPGRW